MYILRSKKTGIDCGWSQNLWKTGGFEITDDGSGLPTPMKVIAGIEKVTGLNLATTAPTPAPLPDPLDAPEPTGILTPAAEAAPLGEPEAPATFVTDALDPATVPTDVFSGAIDTNAEDNT
jgi:hypothetical protein